MLRASLSIALALLMLPALVDAQASSDAERKRLAIEKQLLLPQTPPPPAEPAREEPESPPSTATPTQPAPPTAAAPSVVFDPEIFRLLQAKCRTCHVAGGMAATSGLIFRGDARADFAAVRRFVEPKRPRASALVNKAAGQAHGGGIVLATGSRGDRRLSAWIAAGALFDAEQPGVATVPSTATVPAPHRARPPPLAAAPPIAAASPASPETASVVESTPVNSAPAAASTVAPGPDFASAVEPLLMSHCGSCHNPKGMAASSHLLLSGDAKLDHESLLPFVNLGQPAQSLLLTKAAGTAHGGGPQLPAASDGHALLLAWIRAGAPGPAAVAPAAGQQSAAAPVLAPSAPSTTDTASAPPPTAATGQVLPGGLVMPLGLRLNGRFDLNYERRGIGRDHSFAEGTSALRSYHQFLFLSRSSEDDPIGLLVEVIGLQFWEANFHHHFVDVPLDVVVRGGKLLVPFGNEPLFHQAYGGLAGFDQKILPVVWAMEGLSGSAVYHYEGLSLTGDAYAVRGYGLKTADAIINLQNDFSAIDDVKVAFGARLGAAYGPVTAYYSLYFNPLGVGRRLLMQAIDVSLWRLHGIPVLDRLALGAGMMRADVSGGGPGKDYYHFGSYFQARFYATSFLYVQYRQGLRTFNNRRGVFIDNTRLTADDASTQTLGIVGRYHGLTLGVHYFLNFEKADEFDNDFFRVTAAYEF